jgi:hypothetical protein
MYHFLYVKTILGLFLEQFCINLGVDLVYGLSLSLFCLFFARLRMNVGTRLLTLSFILSYPKPSVLKHLTL